MLVVVVLLLLLVVHQDLETHDEALALAPAVGSDHGGRAHDADAAVVVVDDGGATLLPEVEDALPSREHGGEKRGGEEGGRGPRRLLT